MSNMHLVTGYAGLPHVTAADMASLYAALFGHGSYVLDRGNRFAATVVTNNSISIASGDLLLQGRHVRIEDGTTVELTIESGTSGNKRSDLIVARYTRNSSTGVEEVNLVVLKGTQTTGTPADPDYTPGNIIQDKALVADVPLYRIPLDGLTVGTPVRLFEVKWSVEKQIHDQFLDAAPLDHSASTTKYGIGTDGEYGHVKLSDSIAGQSIKAANGIAASPYAVYQAYQKAAAAAAAASSAQNTAGSKAPSNHASTGTDYGAGSASKYGHVMLSDATDQDSGADTGVAATPAAVNAVRAALANVKAATAIDQTEQTIASGTTDIPIDLFTAPVSGFYFINVCVQWDTKPGGWRNARLTTMSGGELIPVSDASSMVHHTLSDAVYLPAGKQVQLVVRQTSGAALKVVYFGRYSCIPM